MDKILVIGACGQLGTELTLKLRELFGTENVIASDLREAADLIKDGPFESLDVMNKEALDALIAKHQITQIYHLAAILSAKGEQNPKFAWDLNMTSLLNVLEAGKNGVSKIYWPSSIAVFGPGTPKTKTPQNTVMDPNTVYGISKLAGERWCEYYFNKFNVDVRSLRYPGLVGWKAAPGGGTTDYAVHIFHEAIKHGKYQSFLSENTSLPMMYMPDAIRATIELMEAPVEQVKIRSSYNLAGISFTPKQIATEISKHIPNFEMSYKPDFRQEIANSWPQSIDDSFAQKDWGWKTKYDLQKMTGDMMENLKAKYEKIVC